MKEIVIIFVLLVFVVLMMKKTMAKKTGGKEQKRKTKSTNRRAYVMLMFGGDSYLPGVLTLAYSIRKTESKYDIVCMATDDVPAEAISAMERNNIIVVQVPYLEYKSKPMASAKQQAAYGKWIGKSYTKWNCLSLTQYDKILFLDADMLVQKNIDHMFERYRAPAARFTNEIYKTRYDWKSTVKPAEIKNALHNRLPVGNASVMMLTPNAQHYERIKTMIKSMEPFGLNSMSGMDEQAIAYFMSVYNKGPRYTWDNIEAKYECSWRANTPNAAEEAYILNFTGTVKPWERDISVEFEDTKKWYAMNKEMKDN
jgi:alpha-N-acetylglucosamine transferase